MKQLKIENLKTEKEEAPILNGVSFVLSEGEKVLLMGPNGSGKTSLAMALLGDPSVNVVSGKIVLDGKDITKLEPDKRAKLGLFVGFQNPVEIPGVNVYDILLAGYRAVHSGENLDIEEFRAKIDKIAVDLQIDNGLLSRGLNEGFSGGEKKKMELLQMLVLKPAFVILDEPDSGLDADAIKIVAKAISMLDAKTAVMVISHDAKRIRINDFNKVLILKNGLIVEEGGMELIDRVGKVGYESKE